MIIVGLTGSVASGKSTVAGWMRETGIAIHDADAAVHSLLAANGQAVAEIIATFGPDIGAFGEKTQRRYARHLQPDLGCHCRDGHPNPKSRPSLTRDDPARAWLRWRRCRKSKNPWPPRARNDDPGGGRRQKHSEPRRPEPCPQRARIHLLRA